MEQDNNLCGHMSMEYFALDTMPLDDPIYNNLYGGKYSKKHK